MNPLDKEIPLPIPLSSNHIDASKPADTNSVLSPAHLPDTPQMTSMDASQQAQAEEVIQTHLEAGTQLGGKHSSITTSIIGAPLTAATEEMSAMTEGTLTEKIATQAFKEAQDIFKKISE